MLCQPWTWKEKILWLRPFTQQDAMCHAEIEFQDDAIEYLKPYSESKPEWIKNYDFSKWSHSWAVDFDGDLVGRVSLFNYRSPGKFDAKEAEDAFRSNDSGSERNILDTPTDERQYAIVIKSQLNRQGLGSQASEKLIRYAFDELDIKLLVAVVHPENKKCIGLLKKLKFRHSDEVKKRAVEMPDYYQNGFLRFLLP